MKTTRHYPWFADTADDRRSRSVMASYVMHAPDQWDFLEKVVAAGDVVDRIDAGDFHPPFGIPYVYEDGQKVETLLFISWARWVQMVQAAGVPCIETR